MDKDLFKQELWASIDKVASNLYYLDHFRDRQNVIEPLYRGGLGVIAVISAVLSFLDIAVLAKTIAVITAVMASIPFFFPVLPKSSDFDKMSKLRVSVSQYLIKLEELWISEWTDEKYKEYILLNTEFIQIENELATLFGRNSKKLIKKAHEDANRYLDKFFTS